MPFCVATRSNYDGEYQYHICSDWVTVKIRLIEVLKPYIESNIFVNMFDSSKAVDYLCDHQMTDILSWIQTTAEMSDLEKLYKFLDDFCIHPKHPDIEVLVVVNIHNV